jgi:hypothetical protein
MPYDIVIGREESERQKFGDRGTIFIGKHYVKMGQTTSSQTRFTLMLQRAMLFSSAEKGALEKATPWA